MKISTSILSSKDRVKSVLELNNTSASYVHVDVMDGKFVKDVQFDTYEKIHSIHLVSKKKMDVHLMMERPLSFIEKLDKLNIEFITFHVEVGRSIKKIIDTIHDMGYSVGMAIKPDTDISELKPYLDDIEMVLVMSVEPGKGGQKFLNKTVKRIKEVKDLIGDRKILVEVDGGINDTTISLVSDVDICVVGSYIINSDNYRKTILELINGKGYREYPYGDLLLSCICFLVSILTFYYKANGLILFLRYALMIVGFITFVLCMMNVFKKEK